MAAVPMVGTAAFLLENAHRNLPQNTRETGNTIAPAIMCQGWLLLIE